MGHLLENVIILELGACIPLSFLEVLWLLYSFLTLLTLSLDGRQHLFVVMFFVLAYYHLIYYLLWVIFDPKWLPLKGVAFRWLRLCHPLVRGHAVIVHVFLLDSSRAAARLGVISLCSRSVDCESIDCLNKATRRICKASR